MNLGFYNFYRQYNQNRMFHTVSAEIGDDLIYPSVYLAKRVRELGHSVATIDTAPLESFDAVVFLDYPTILNSYFRRLVKNRDKPIYLVMFESPAVRPDNWRLANHAPFKKVFTWSPALADGRKYIRMRMPFKLPDFAPYQPSQADKFCCLIASQKYSWASQELYTERVRAIRWFEKNHPGEFDLYGQRWDRFFFQKKLSVVNPVLNLVYRKCPWLPRRRRFPSARGSVATKRDILRQYKFSICYENASYPGWITEKILDPMFAGCVPIYQGDPEVAEFVPKEAFIDKRQFADYESLYRYLKEMPPAQYEAVRQAIHKFVHGEAIKPMGPEAFTDLIVREVINDHPIPP
ncbi:MAG: glycosyltransferase family 10 domain-containing protein [Limisphaerales bacterium]